MNIEHLQEFAVVGRTANIAAAARSLHVASSTLSKHLSSLEGELGLQLIHRTSNSIRLTSEGKIFLEWALGVVEGYERTVEAMRRSAKEPISLVRLGGNLLNQRVGELVRAAAALVARRGLRVELELHAPHLSRSTTELAANDPYEAARKGLVDVSLLAVCDEQDWSGFEHRTLFRDPLLLLVGEGDVLAQRASVSLADLHSRTLVVMTSYSNYWIRSAEACRLSGFEPNLRTRLSDSVDSFYVAKDADEVFLVTASSAASLVSRREVSGLVEVSIDDPNAYFEFQVVYRVDSTNPGIPIFLEVLDEICAATVGREAAGVTGVMVPGAGIEPA